MARLASVSLVSVILVVAAGASESVNPTVLTSFGVNLNGGSNIYGGVILDARGDLYGATADGGAHGSGVVYRLSGSGGSWTETVLYSFRGGLLDGANPHASLTWDGQQTLYGTTIAGGLNHNCTGGCGVVFSLVPISRGQWMETVIYRFTGGADGSVPYAGLTMDSSGNLYGATSTGGSSGFGVVYKLSYSPTSGWAQTVLHSFSGSADGATPFSAPILDQAGNLYGVTYYGGPGNFGTVYQISPVGDSWKERILYAFEGASDGANPAASLVFDQAGNLYGTTVLGGSASVGTAFELNAAGAWTKTVLHNFLGLSSQDGANPNGLIFDSAGNLWGTTVAGGLYNPGTIFELVPQPGGVWQETVDYSFTGGNDGAYPSAGLVLDPFGRFYGTTLWGGLAGHTVGGVAFEIVP